MNHPSEVTESPIEIQLSTLRTTLGDDLVQSTDSASLVMIVEESFNFDDTRAFFALAN